MDFIDSFSTKILYTEKEKKLHVTGTFETCSDHFNFNTNIINNEYEKLNVSEYESFYEFGYFISKSVVDLKLIQNAREYINIKYKDWLKLSKRQDDWRCHLLLNLTNITDQPIEHPSIIRLLLESPILISKINLLLGCPISGIFYTQIAYRTSVTTIIKNISQQQDAIVPYYSPGAEYHLDGNANASGTRFPDPWTLLVGIALVNIDSFDMGNFTIFPGYHTKRNWSNYPDEKRSKTLPDLGEPVHVCLQAGDVVFAHVLLPHRGGKNIHSVNYSNDNTSTSNEDSNDIESTIDTWNIPKATREMIFIRVRSANVNYENVDRNRNILSDPWIEFPYIKEKFQK